MSCNPSWHSGVLREVLWRSVTREPAEELSIWHGVDSRACHWTITYGTRFALHRGSAPLDANLATQTAVATLTMIAAKTAWRAGVDRDALGATKFPDFGDSDARPVCERHS